MHNRKSPTQADLLALLKKGRLQFPPFEIGEVKTQDTLDTNDTILHLDAILPLRWRDRTYRFGVEIRRLWTPKIITEAMDTVGRHISIGQEGLLGNDAGQPLYPLILVPYLNEEWLRKLEVKGVSGIDFCGNGVIVVPNELLVMRTGFPNRFSWEGTIKNVYRKNSSVVARVFLLIPEFSSIKNAHKQIARLGGELTLATVSKVCKSLEDDLVIERSRHGKPPVERPPVSRRPGDEFPRSPKVGPSPVQRQLRLLQPEKLLGLLVDNYAPPRITRTFHGKWPKPLEDLAIGLQILKQQIGAKIVLTGASSVEAYAIMAREPIHSFYCSDLDGILKILGTDIQETDRFTNVRLLETRDNFVYFDKRSNSVASPIQTYLELVKGDKRERETAEQVKKVIFAELAHAGWRG
jgi:hypothetical protein